MTVLQVCGVALSVLMFCLQAGKKSRGAVVAAAVLFFTASLDGVSRLFTFVKEQEQLWGQGEYTVLMKALGIGVVCQFTAELCRDAGETVLASRVEFFAKIEILLLSVPLLQKLLAFAGELAG